MALKFVLFIVVLMHLKICVSGISPAVCMGYVNKYSEVAEGFAEENATKENLEVTINTIKNAAKKDMRYLLTQCYKIRKVKSF